MTYLTKCAAALSACFSADRAALKLTSCLFQHKKHQFKEAHLYYVRFSRKSKTKTRFHYLRNLTLYNFGIFIANAASDENRKKQRNPDNKYLYEVDFSNAIKTVRKYLLRKDYQKPVDLIKLVMKYVHAVKDEFRHFDRNLRGIGAIHFNYR